MRDHELGYTPYSPLAGGVLTGQYRRDTAPAAGSRMAIAPFAIQPLNDDTWAGLDALAARADHRGVSTSGLALAWVLNRPEVTAALVAPRNPTQFAAVREALTVTLDPDERADLTRLFPTTSAS